MSLRQRCQIQKVPRLGLVTTEVAANGANEQLHPATSCYQNLALKLLSPRDRESGFAWKVSGIAAPSPPALK